MRRILTKLPLGSLTKYHLKHCEKTGGQVKIVHMKSLVFILLVIIAGCGHKKPAIENQAILDFYSTKDPYGEFSNFALFPVFVDGRWWRTTEHYYQAHKYEKPELISWVQEAESPMEAALRGRDKNIPKRKDWDLRKDEFMEKAVRDKFTRYPELKKLLLSTGDARIYEHTKNDCYWGDCGDRTGQNKLGLLLEKIRLELSKTSP